MRARAYTDGANTPSPDYPLPRYPLPPIPCRRFVLEDDTAHVDTQTCGDADNSGHVMAAGQNN